jgi:hypothetical protein
MASHALLVYIDVNGIVVGRDRAPFHVPPTSPIRPEQRPSISFRRVTDGRLRVCDRTAQGNLEGVPTD